MKPEGVKTNKQKPKNKNKKQNKTKNTSGGRGGNQVWLSKENTPQVVSTLPPLILDDLSSWKICPHADESVIFHLKIRQTSFLLSLFSSAQNILFWWNRAADQQTADQIISLALVRSWQNQQKLCSATEASSQIKVNLQIHLLSTDTIYVFPFCLASSCATNFIWRILVVMKHCYNLGWAKHV